jgi:hypothetical protein
VDENPEKTSRKLEEKKARREAEERRAAERKAAQRKRSLVTIGLALLVGALVVGLIYSERSGEEEIASVGADEAGCGDIVEHELLGRDHVDEGAPIEYNTSPPTSGSHYANFADPAFYSAPVEPERLVHNLEHGQIVIWFSPDAPDQTIDSIENYVSGELPNVLASPYEGDFSEGSGDYVLTGWGASQVCSEFSIPVIEAFREQFQGKGPEQVGIQPFQAD